MTLPNLDAISKWIDAAQNWPGYVWAAALAFVVCFLWTKFPDRWCPNGALWLAAAASAMVINLYLSAPAPADAPKGPYRLKLALIGFIIGLAVRALYHSIVAYAGQRWPILKTIFDSNGTSSDTGNQGAVQQQQPNQTK